MWGPSSRSVKKKNTSDLDRWWEILRIHPFTNNVAIYKDIYTYIHIYIYENYPVYTYIYRERDRVREREREIEREKATYTKTE